jgi:hypothetical protein
MDEEEKKRMVNELKKEHTLKFLEDTDMPITIATNPSKGYIRGEVGSQNIKFIVPKNERDASATIEKEIDLDENIKAIVAHELRKKGKEGTGLHLKTPNFNIGGSTDYDKEEMGYISGQTKTPFGNIGARFNTDFTQNENGEIFFRSPNGEFIATGYTDFGDLQKARMGYNTDKLNINYDTDFGDNEYLKTEYRPTENVMIRAGTDFGNNRNISAGLNYPINENLLVDALLERNKNFDEDENRIMFGLRGRF